MNKKVFIGLAWPYANGSLHLGHASAFLGADILARYYRLAGDDVLLVSGSDCYGTPIAIEASQKSIPPSEIANKYHEEFKRTLVDGLNFSYDIYTRTDTEQHTKSVQDLFLKLYKKGLLYTKTENALYSPLLKRFLPDRFVEGECPKCGYKQARGDQCDECGSLLDPLELINPKINQKILGKDEISKDNIRLEIRASEHFYLRLTALQDKLKDWVNQTSDPWRSNARNYAKSFLEQGLQDRAITRDTEWGVPIPLLGYETKSIYVWFEAVAGYLSASQSWSEDQNKPNKWEEWWHNDNAIHYYVHGKDNIPFHTIIWPAIILAEGKLHLPDRIISSEYLSLEGKQFSKSRNWAVWLPDFLKNFDSETLRFFLTVNGPESSDADFVWAKYAQRVNSELIGTFGNLINRILSFSKNNFPDGIEFPKILDKESEELLYKLENAFKEVGDLIENGKFRAAFKVILEISEHGNRYFNDKEPWAKIKDKTNLKQVESDLGVCLHLVRTLALLVNPFLPETTKKIYDFLGLKLQGEQWSYPIPHDIQYVISFSPLYQRIDEADIISENEKLKKN